MKKDGQFQSKSHTVIGRVKPPPCSWFSHNLSHVFVVDNTSHKDSNHGPSDSFHKFNHRNNVPQPNDELSLQNNPIQ